jgi:hypothetical protein
MKKIVKALVEIERDCSYLDAYSQSKIEYEKFYERVKGVMIFTGEKSLKKVEDDCKLAGGTFKMKIF